MIVLDKQKRKSIFIIIITMIIVTIMGIVISNNVVSAIPSGLGIGSKLTIGADEAYSGINEYKLSDTDWLYCIDGPKCIGSGETNTYTVNQYMEIIGNYATFEDGTNTYTSLSTLNGTIAYILANESSEYGGYGSYTGNAANHGYTLRQCALWVYWAEHYDTLNTDVWKGQLHNHGIESGTIYEDYKKAYGNYPGKTVDSLITPAGKWAENYGSNVSATITGADSVTFTDEYASYKADYTGTMKSINIKYTDGTSEDVTDRSNYIKFYDSDKKEEISITQIKSGEKFYIKNDSDKILQEMTLKVNVDISDNSTMYGVGIYFMTSSTASQPLIAVNPITKVLNDSADKTVKIKETRGNLKIHKVDSASTSTNLPGAKFKIYSETLQKWVNIQDGKVTYSTTDGTEVTTDDSGIISINGIKYGTYTVYETATPKGYDITKQNGYGTDTKYPNYVNLGKVEITPETVKENKEYTFTNDKVVDKLKGRVWIDDQNGKGNNVDSIYTENSNDSLLKGITVKLYTNMVIGNTITGKQVATTITDDNGEYEFTKTDDGNNLLYSDISNAYVEFEYDNQTYVAVETFAGENLTVNSKAKEYTIYNAEQLDDNYLTGTTGKYPGRAITNPEEDALTMYYNEDTYTIENINLGLWEKLTPNYNITESLAYVKICMNGYTYTYNYGKEAATSSDFTPKVSSQDEKDPSYYKVSIYPSDIEYNVDNSTEELKVYVVYDIFINDYEQRNIDYLYKENKLHLESLTNKYDTDRYSLCDSMWTDNGNGVATYNIKDDKDAKIDNEKSVIDIDEGGYVLKNITFQIKEEALEDMLTRKESDENIEKIPTSTTAIAYHEYSRKDNMWKKDTAIKTYKTNNSQDEEEKDDEFIHRSVSTEEKDQSVYIKLLLRDSRTISGTIFEDTDKDDDKKALGDGIKQDDEKNRAKDVTVELLCTDKNTVATLYQTPNGEAATAKEAVNRKSASVKSQEDGTYSFKGVVPGYYYIRFTYGDGKQTLCKYNQDGTITEEVALKSSNYKSTIINTNANEAGDIIKNAIEADQSTINDILNQTDYTKLTDEQKKIVEWYKYLGENDYSIATDNLTQRALNKEYIYNSGDCNDNSGASISIPNYNSDGTINGYTTYVKSDSDDYKYIAEDGSSIIYPYAIDAYTPLIGISIENDASKTDGNKFDEFNFGIITSEEVPTVYKVIKNITLTAQNGTTLVDANPTDKDAKYISALDNIIGGSQYTKFELEEGLIYGTELETTYEITVTNESKLNYQDDEYQIYGTGGTQEVTITPTIKDYLDEKYDWSSVELIETSGVTKEEKEEQTTNDDGTITTTKYEEFTTNWNLKSGESNTITYTVRDLLATSDDLNYTNDAKIGSVKLSLYGSIDGDGVGEDDSRTSLPGTSSTGADRSNIYWVAITTGLIVISCGIVFIKKKILN